MLPRKYNLQSTFEIKINGIAYISVEIPGDTVQTQASDAIVTMLNGANSTLSVIKTGLTYNDLRWTNGWRIDIWLPKVPDDKVKLELVHTPTGGASSDVSVDNLVVGGGTCGTNLACKCTDGVSGGSKYTQKGDLTNNADSNLNLAETVAYPSLGGANTELTCAQCHVQGTRGAIYTRSYPGFICPTSNLAQHR